MTVKSQLIKSIAKHQHDMTEHDVEVAVNHLIDHLCDTLVQGERIEIRNFGGITPKEQASRRARNPKTGKKLIAPPKRTLHFKLGKGLFDRVNVSMANGIKINEAKE